MHSFVSLQLFAFFIHFVFLYAIFDIFYTSPIIPNLRSFDVIKGQGVAARLFFISADGLRLDTFMENPDKAPFLHDLMQSRKCSWGRSVSSVPTESRPGHVAMFAGFTEDVSAVARGWRHNPVEFDTIFNRTAASWLWGSEDITHLFSHVSRTQTQSFSPDLEDFDSLENYKLDDWVFTKVEEFLRKSGRDDDVRGDGRIFFLHLVGLDTNGHGHKPHSAIYKDNLRVVDEGIRKLHDMVHDAFGDNRTAFIFTSDHGMTDWGSHGAGSHSEVLTPFVVFGSGVAAGHSNKEISQIDLCPLAAALLGVAVPTNSYGILPVYLLAATPKYVFNSVFANFLQLKETISAQLDVLKYRLWGLPRGAMKEKAIQSLEEESKRLAAQSRYSSASSLLSTALPSLQSSILLYHRVDSGPLGMALSLSFLLWITLVRTELQGESLSAFSSAPPLAFLVPFSVCFVLMYMLTSLSLSHTLYVFLPFFLCMLLLKQSGMRWKTLAALYQHLSEKVSSMSKEWISLATCVIFILLMSIVFHNRNYLALLIIGLAFYPNSLHFVRASQRLRFWWRVLCVCIVPFSILPPAGRLPLPFLSFIPPLVAAILFRLLLRPLCSREDRLLMDQLISISFLFSSLIGASSLYPCFLLRLLCWLSLPLPAILTSSTTPKSPLRLLSLMLSLFLPYCMVSSSYESCFLLLFCGLLLILCLLHSASTELANFFACKLLPSQEFWRENQAGAPTVLTLVLISLFCTGNLASLSSFDPSTLNRLLSVFSPFTMASLLLIKLAAPTLLVAIALRCTINFSCAMSEISWRVLISCDSLALLFLQQLKTTGSWADIGTSIAHYVIAICTALVLNVLFLLAEFLLTFPPYLRLFKQYSSA